MPPALALALGIIGAAAVLRWCVREVQRANSELDDVRRSGAAESVDRNTLPKLKRDPETGEYRPG